MIQVAQIYARHDSLWFAALMTQIQCDALAKKCDFAKALIELTRLDYFAELPRRPEAEQLQISQWAQNAWNTECVLRMSRTMFEGEGLRNCLQWAFPQACYSVYALTVAYFVASGFTERSHRAVIQKFGRLALQNKYPPTTAFVADGPSPFQYHNLNPSKLRSTSHYEPEDSSIVDAQIAQFLNGTRDDELVDKKADMKLKTKAGRLKRGFNKADWEATAAKLGPTSLLSLLYRKRIKANYRDIDTFLARNLDPGAAFDSLISVVNCINGLHESLLRKAIGSEVLEGIVQRNPNPNREFLVERLHQIGLAAP